MLPERLSLVHVGNVHLDDRPVEAVQRIEDGDRRMGERRWVYDNPRGALAGPVNPVDDLVFAIALMKLDREAECFAYGPAFCLDVGERLAAIKLRLALAEQIEIGAVQDHDDRTHALPPQ